MKNTIPGVRYTPTSIELTELKKDQLPMQELVRKLWTDGIEYEGENVFENFYMHGSRKADSQWFRLMEGDNVDIKEVYLGYDVESQEFILGYDAWKYSEDGDGGSCCVSYAAVASKDALVIRITERGDDLFYASAYRQLHNSRPNLLDIRLS